MFSQKHKKYQWSCKVIVGHNFTLPLGSSGSLCVSIFPNGFNGSAGLTTSVWCSESLTHFLREYCFYVAVVHVIIKGHVLIFDQIIDSKKSRVLIIFVVMFALFKADSWYSFCRHARAINKNLVVTSSF